MKDPWRPIQARWPWTTTNLVLAATVVLGAALIGERTLTQPLNPDSELARQAAGAQAMMLNATRHLALAKEAAGLPPLPGVRPDERGLIGEELTPLVTTLGSLEAKQTAAVPRWAYELTFRLHDVGVGQGDIVAASFSGSFPGLNLAVISACASLDARLLAISSVTSSTWGATEPGFTWPEMETRLVRARMIRPASVGISVGGDRDCGRELETTARRQAEYIAESVGSELGAEYLRADDLATAINNRLSLYQRLAGHRLIKVYINCGGNTASLGESNAVLKIQSGFLRTFPFDLSKKRGIMAEFAARGIPVLHLLNIRELAFRWGIHQPS